MNQVQQFSFFEIRQCDEHVLCTSPLNMPESVVQMTEDIYLLVSAHRDTRASSAGVFVEQTDDFVAQDWIGRQSPEGQLSGVRGADNQDAFLPKTRCPQPALRPIPRGGQNH